jgi:methionyl-tRNA synthetase
MNYNNSTLSPETLIVTCALPYANGELHLGHLIEQIQADIWVRFHKMQEKKCYFICGADTHGTPIMLKAAALKITPEELIHEIRLKHIQNFSAFSISFDHYYTTHSNENKQLIEEVYTKLCLANKISKKKISQLYDEKEQMFLPDRFIKGGCPKCKTPEQYGDSCENCGATYNASELLNPYSVISGTLPILRETEHYFFFFK